MVEYKNCPKCAAVMDGLRECPKCGYKIRGRKPKQQSSAGDKTEESLGKAFKTGYEVGKESKTLRVQMPNVVLSININVDCADPGSLRAFQVLMKELSLTKELSK